MERLPEDLSIDLFNNWLYVDEASKLAEAAPETNKFYKNVISTGMVEYDELVAFKKDFLKSKMIFTRLKIVVITESLMRYIHFLGKRLKEIVLYNRRYKGLKELLEIVPDDKVTYDSYIPYDYKLDAPVRRLSIKASTWDQEEPDFEEYLVKYGHLITHITGPGVSAVVNSANRHLLTLVMKYCTNLKSLYIGSVLKDDFYIESLEEVIGIMGNFDNLHLCTNIKRIKNCNIMRVPPSLVNITSIIDCTIIQLPLFIMNKLEKCFINNCDQDYNYLLNLELIRITLFKQFPTPEQIRQFPGLKIAFVGNKKNSSIKELKNYFPHIDFYYYSNRTDDPFNVGKRDVTMYDGGYSTTKISHKLVNTLSITKNNFEDVYKLMVRLEHLSHIMFNYLNEKPITSKQIKKMITTIPKLSSISFHIDSDDYKEFCNVVSKYSNHNISYSITVNNLKDEDIVRIAQLTFETGENVKFDNQILGDIVNNY